MQGLITKDRKDIDPAALPFAKDHHEIEGLGLREGAGLLEVVTLMEYLWAMYLSGLDKGAILVVEIFVFIYFLAMCCG